MSLMPPSKFRQLRDLAKQHLKVKPHSGHLWWDFFLILVLVAIQQTILRDILGQHLLIDLLTPWIIACLVFQPMHQSLMICGLAALALETHSTAPSGIYFVCYWLIAVGIFLVKNTLSWQHLLPWTLVMAAAEIWVSTFESVILGFSVGLHGFSVPYFLQQIFRVVTAVGFGLLLTHHFRKNFFLEGKAAA